ncbi:MAG: DNA ligase D [Planctomycetes bacterium]|nr:DNA ligase D [Planctomycetota bacterium]
MTLREYVSKRRLDGTPEPGVRKRRAQRRGAPIFVVQLHHARARHYDFRLEIDGALKSWAVPKGPSLRAGERRLAVQVEDHPLEYAKFEGEIPTGHYGAGHVAIFDSGTWSSGGKQSASAQIDAGKLVFELAGEKLRGKFTLVRTRGEAKQPQWLLIKGEDRFAREADADALLEHPRASPAVRAEERPRPLAKPTARARKRSSAPKRSARPSGGSLVAEAAASLGAKRSAMPVDVELQLATLRAHPPSDTGWLHEIKWDGYRLLALRGRSVRLRSRGGEDWTARFPHLVAAIEELPGRQLVLDGELIALDAEGRSDFAALQRDLESDSVSALRFVVFDLLHLEGYDLRGVSQRRRGELLVQLLEASPAQHLQYAQPLSGSSAAALQACVDAGLEGVICKREDAPYRGGRTQAWIKLKNVADEEFVVVGFTAPKGGRAGFGSLLLATPERGGLRYCGRVGSGFDAAALSAGRRKLERLRTSRPAVVLPSHVPFSARTVTWVRPTLVVDVHSRGRGKEGLIRQASFVRYRDDKSVRDPAVRGPEVRPMPELERSSEIEITHPDRVVFPDAALTKRDVADYYAKVAPWLLPELRERPLSLLRCPNGIGAACFFQKHLPRKFGAHVHAVAIEESKGGSADYPYVRDAAGLRELVQGNVLELHAWGARRRSPERPDRIVFDLDPHESVPWTTVKRAARDVRAALASLGLESWVRLSGGKGLHVVAPIRPGPDWARVKAFCAAFAEALVAREPALYVATASKAARKGRIYIDWLRNARGATSIASWSLRARPGAPVAMPLRWSELARCKAPAEFDLKRAVRRAAKLREDPWQGISEARQSLPRIG